jgi:hypothetical protein
LRQENDDIRQGALRGEAEFVTPGDGEQLLAAQDERFAMRHLQAKTADAAVLLDDTAQNARRRQHDAGIDVDQQLFQFGAAQRGRGEIHRPVFPWIVRET